MSAGDPQGAWHSPWVDSQMPMTGWAQHGCPDVHSYLPHPSVSPCLGRTLLWGFGCCRGFGWGQGNLGGPCGLQFRWRFVLWVLVSGCQPSPKLELELNWKGRREGREGSSTDKMLLDRYSVETDATACRCNEIHKYQTCSNKRQHPL